MKLLAVGLFALFSAMALPAGQDAKAAPPTPPAQTPEEVVDKPITLEVTRVNILFTVTDKKGRFVRCPSRGSEDSPRR